MPLDKLAVYIAAALACWTLLLLLLGRSARALAMFRVLCAVLTGLAVFGILLYTVLRRTPTDVHMFRFFAVYTDEFYREMFMNVLLYLPLGLTLTAVIGQRALVAAFLLSLGIESWQYFAGAGLAQGSDVICNSLGAALGALPYGLVSLLKQKNHTE